MRTYLDSPCRRCVGMATPWVPGTLQCRWSSGGTPPRRTRMSSTYVSPFWLASQFSVFAVRQRPCVHMHFYSASVICFQRSWLFSASVPHFLVSRLPSVSVFAAPLPSVSVRLLHLSSASVPPSLLLLQGLCLVSFQRLRSFSSLMLCFQKFCFTYNEYVSF